MRPGRGATTPQGIETMSDHDIDDDRRGRPHDDHDLEGRLRATAARERAVRPPRSLAGAVEHRIAARRVHGLVGAATAAAIVLAAGVALGLAWSRSEPHAVVPGPAEPHRPPAAAERAADAGATDVAAPVRGDLSRSLARLTARVDRRLRRESDAAVDAGVDVGTRLVRRFTHQLDDKLALLAPSSERPAAPPAHEAPHDDAASEPGPPA